MDFIGRDKFGVSTEKVEEEKIQYKPLGSFIVHNGNKLYCYNHIEDKVTEVVINYSNTIHVVARNGRLTTVDYEAEKCKVDPRFAYFEAMNYKTAENRVKRWKEGKCKKLENLLEYNPEGITLLLKVK